MTPFVAQQRAHATDDSPDLLIPVETIYHPGLQDPPPMD